MSRIHDALRRGQRPAATPSAKQTAQSDAVLAALGYRSRRDSGLGAVLLGLAAVLVLTGLLIWTYWPASAPTQAPAKAVVTTAPRSTVTPRVNPLPAMPVPVPTPAPVPSTVAASLPPPLLIPRDTRAEAPLIAAAPRAQEPAPRVAPRAPATRNTRPAPRDTQPAATESQPAPLETLPAPRDPNDFQLALYYQRTGDFEQALVAYKKVLQRDALNVEAHNNLGMLYQGKGLYDEAAREFQRVIAIDPRYVTAHLNLSAAYLKLGRSDAAAAEARSALAIDPRHSDALVNLALAQVALGQPGDARQSLRRALEIDPHHAAAHYNLAQQYEKTGELAFAIDHYRQFLQYAGIEQTAYVADVRAHLLTLTKGTR